MPTKGETKNQNYKLLRIICLNNENKATNLTWIMSSVVTRMVVLNLLGLLFIAMNDHRFVHVPSF